MSAAATRAAAPAAEAAAPAAPAARAAGPAAKVMVEAWSWGPSIHVYSSTYIHTCIHTYVRVYIHTGVELGQDQGQQMRLELNYRSSSSVLSAAMAMLKPAYEGRPDEQLNLVSATARGDDAPTASGDDAADTADGGDADGADGAGACTATGAAGGNAPAPSKDVTNDNGARIGNGAHADNGARIGNGAHADIVAAAPRLVPRRQPSVEVIEVADQDHEAAVVVERLLHMYHAADESGTPRPSVAVLYRTNAQALPFERELVRQGVPYQLMQQRTRTPRDRTWLPTQPTQPLCSTGCKSPPDCPHMAAKSPPDCPHVAASAPGQRPWLRPWLCFDLSSFGLSLAFNRVVF